MTTTPNIPPVAGLFEMVLEVENLAISEAFYAGELGLSVVDRWQADRPAVWLSLGNQAFLGLWPVTSGGKVAIHGGRGGSHVHFAIRIPNGTLSTFRTHLEARGHHVGFRDFGDGNLALYLDDPDGNVVELTERTTLWGGKAAIEPTPID